MNEKLRTRREICEKCIAACERCAGLLPLGNGLAAGGRDIFEACARMCALAAEEMRLDSAYRAHICALCVILCRACGDECRQHRGEDFALCAAACEQAALECRATALRA